MQLYWIVKRDDTSPMPTYAEGPQKGKEPRDEEATSDGEQAGAENDG